MEEKKSVSDLLQQLKDGNLEEYYRIIAWCEGRSGITDGICNVVGLDDLTQGADPDAVFEGAPQDEKLKYLMAVGAMLYTEIFSERAQESEVYSPVSRAMGAMAATFFQMDREDRAIPYYEIFEKYTGRP